MDNYVGVLAPAAFLLLLVVTMVASFSRDAKHREVIARLTRLERNTRLIMEHLGMQQVPPELPQVAALLAEGKKIQAIKAYREATGVGLRQAKDAVERMS